MSKNKSASPFFGDDGVENRSHYQNIFHRLAQAFDALRIGRVHHARALISKAQKHSEDHVKQLISEGKHSEAADFHPSVKPYFDRANHVYNRVLSRQRKLNKGESFEKAVSYPQDKPAGLNPKYDYKHYSELPPHDQIKATHAFQDKDMDHYHYATDKKSGEFVFTTRVKMSNPNLKEKSGSNQALTAQPHIAKQHIPGSTVRIDAHGTALHNKLAIVRPTNPNVPNKIKVQVGGTNDVAYVEPHQVKLHKSESNTRIEKGKRVIEHIRKIKSNLND
jgi:hypothetical protein